MINSGVPLRGLLIATKDGDWGESTPGEVTVPYRVIRGADFPRARVGDLSGVPLRFLRPETVGRRTLEPDDILIETAGGSNDRPTGRTLLITARMLGELDSPATCASFCRFLRVDCKRVDPRYLYWYLQHIYQQGGMWEHQVQHTGIARFQFTTFAESLRISLPTLMEQGAVAQVLSALDDKVELNHRMNQTLEAMARAIFKSWFVDFDPVRKGHPLFTNSFRESSLGLIPKDWGVGVLGDLVEDTIGGDWGMASSSNAETEATLCVRGADIPQLQGAGTGKMPIRFISLSSLAKRALRDGDLVIEISGGSPSQSTGRCVLIRKRLLDRFSYPLICSNFCRIVRPRLPQLSSFLHFWLDWLYSKDEFLKYENGTTGIKNLAFRTFSEIHPLVVPLEPVLQAFNDQASLLLDRQQCNGAESGTLAAIRDALIPKLLSGEIRIKQAEKIVEGVL
jgi:type I restriction enzyme, S subunit